MNRNSHDSCLLLDGRVHVLSQESWGGEGKGENDVYVCIMHFYKCASVCCFYSILQVAGMYKRACVCLVFLTFFTLFSLSSLCAFLCLAFFNSGDLDACYVSKFGGVLSVNLRPKPLFSVICLSRCVWNLFHFNIDVCCIRGKCDWNPAPKSCMYTL